MDERKHKSDPGKTQWPGIWLPKMPPLRITSAGSKSVASINDGYVQILKCMKKKKEAIAMSVVDLTADIAGLRCFVVVLSRLHAQRRAPCGA